MYEKYMGGAVQFFSINRPFTKEDGETLDSLTVAFHTFGTLNEKKDNVVWVCHALTANSDCSEWWPGTVVEGGLLDPSKYFVVCANKLGSCYGSSSGRYTVRDNIRAFQMLADFLGIESIRMLIGGSTGGAQAMEWAIMEPERVERLALLATFSKATAWLVACSEAQRMAIKAALNKDEGLATARAISMLLYRGEGTYNLTQNAQSVVGYQRYQGRKLSERFDYKSYLSMLHTLDTHDVGRGRETVEKALAQITAQTTIIAIDTDILFPPKESKYMAEFIPNAQYHEIHSEYGHDGFLIETPVMSEILIPLLEKNI